MNKLKLWKDVKDINAHYAALLINRGIDAADLDVYKINDGTAELQSKKCFEIVGDYIITKEEFLNYVDIVKDVEYKELTPAELEDKDQAFKDDVDFNNTKEQEIVDAVLAQDQAAFDAAKAAIKTLPLTEVTRNELVTDKRDLQTIPVTKVNMP